MARSTWSVLACVLLLLAPVVAAGWGAKGGFEPDTRHDLDGSMFRSPPQDTNAAYRPVYFQGFFGAAAGAATSVNPNLATAQTALLPHASAPMALLGVWRDCNGDGYVGYGDQGLLEYHSLLLLDVRICPPRAPAPGDLYPSHNDGAWVQEFVPIGYDDVRTSADENPGNLNDTAARVWADWGLPGAATPGACATYPLPPGSMRSTGGFLRYVDCWTSGRAQAALADAGALSGRPDLVAELDRPNPWGDEDDASSARAFDCAEGSDLAVRDPTAPPGDDGALRRVSVTVGDEEVGLNVTDSDGRIVWRTVYQPAPSVMQGGTPAGTVNETEAELTDCQRGGEQDELLDVDGDQRGSDAELVYAPEGDSHPARAGDLRARTDHVFTFEEGRRGDALLGPRAPTDAGAGMPGLTGHWVAAPLPAGGYNAWVDRDTMGAQGVTHVSFYAYVSWTLAGTFGLTLPAGGGSYGADGCERGTFRCEPGAWWRDAQGRHAVPRDARLGSSPASPSTPLEVPATAIGVAIGQAFQLRDVDCYDASALAARDAGAHAGALVNESCARGA